MSDYDALILGGGPAGCAAAIAARQRGMRVALVEAGAYAGPRIGESLPPDAGLLLRALGVWPRFADDGHAPCRGSASSWGDDRLGFNDFVLNPHGHGWHLDRARFDAMLADEAAAAGVALHRRTRYRGHTARPGGGARVTLAGAGGERCVDARVVVDATGRRGLFARDRGARRAVIDRLVAIGGFCVARDDAATSTLTLLEATADGWWYAAALPGGRRVVMVATDADLARQRGLGALPGWSAALAETRHVAAQLGAARPAAVQVWSAPSFALDAPAGPDWIAVGDAAAAFDPLSAQGIYKALDDGLAAAPIIARLAGGDASAGDEWAARAADRFAGFRAQRAHFYAMERRWPDAPFWVRRRAVG